MVKNGITKEFIDNHRVLFDPYMHKGLLHVMPPYAKDTASEVALA